MPKKRKGSARKGKPRVLFAVVSHVLGAEQHVAMVNSWLPRLEQACPSLDVDFRIFIGRKPEGAPRIRVLMNHHMVQLDVDDHYEGLPAKVVGAIGYAVNHDFDYVFKVDTDMLVLPRRFLSFLRSSVIERRVDWMGTVNKMRPKQDGTGKFECNVQRDWHYGKCSRTELNSKPYEGVSPIGVDGGHGYVLSRRAMNAVVDFAAEREEWLEENRYVNIYEDTLVSYMLVSKGFLPVDYSGWAPKNATLQNPLDVCKMMETSPSIHDQLRELQETRGRSEVNLYAKDGPSSRAAPGMTLTRHMDKIGIEVGVKSEHMVPLLSEVAGAAAHLGGDVC